jgi:hypothetical protein
MHSNLCHGLYSEIILVLVQPILYYGIQNIMHAVIYETVQLTYKVCVTLNR